MRSLGDKLHRGYIGAVEAALRNSDKWLDLPMHNAPGARAISARRLVAAFARPC